MGIGCDELFTPRDARAMQELVEEAVGGPCPCKQGKGCLLLVTSEEGRASVPEVA